MMKNKITTYVGIFILGGFLTWAAASLFNQKSNNFNPDNRFENMRNGRGIFDNGQRTQSTRPVREDLSKQNCLMDECLLVDDSEYPVGELDQQTIDYLQAGLADERKAHTFYQSVINNFGSVRPFINIIRAEEQHEAMLKALFDKYGVEIPTDSTLSQTAPTSIIEACQMGVDAEIANDALYQDMIKNITQEDIKTVFINLADASRLMHLPAFEKCN